MQDTLRFYWPACDAWTKSRLYGLAFFTSTEPVGSSQPLPDQTIPE